LIWKDDASNYKLAEESLNSLSEILTNPKLKTQLTEAIISGRFDKEQFGLKDTMILGEDGGLYLLLNDLDAPKK
jgi:hypothetical protein